mgnify:CR=1 FL=1
MPNHSTTALSSFLRLGAVPALLAALICLIPLIAMQFTQEVRWTFSDFTLAFLLLFGGGFAYRPMTRATVVTVYKLGSVLTLATAVFLVFLNGAVGFVGSENNTINVAFLAVPAVLAAGTFAAGRKPLGMARALLATGLAQAVIGGWVLAVGGHMLPGASIAEVLGLSGLFVSLWLAAAWCYWQAATTQM